MPTVNGRGSEEVSSQDEIKVFKYEGDEEESEKSRSENLKEDKSSLITETEEDKSDHGPSSSTYPGSKLDNRLPDPPFGLFGSSTWGSDRLGYLAPLAYSYGTSHMSTKDIGTPSSSLLSLYNGQPHLGQPPPAHMGISPYQLDTKAGLRPPMYPFGGTGQYPYPLSDFTAQMAWLSPSNFIPHHANIGSTLGHSLVPSPKTDLANSSHDNHRHHSDQKANLNNDKSQLMEPKNGGDKKPHIKKPLNAFMLYMKEMRAKVVAECTLKESAAINQILGRKWHALTREEQAKYYEMARKERQMHMQMYPGWSSRQNYSQGKKKKRNRDKTQDGANMKKCRARYGLDQQNQWCKPCRRKKKCVRYHDDGEEQMDTATGSTESPEESLMPESESDNEFEMTQSLPTSLSGSSMMDAMNCSPQSHLMLSPGPSLASPSGPPSMLMPSPASLSSPMTPGEPSRDLNGFDQRPSKAPVGNNPRDINNPLSVNQLTGQCSSTASENAECPTMVRVT